MKSLFDVVSIRGNKIRNRIVMPPMVNFNWTDNSGLITEKHVQHYSDCAKGGTGLIIVESTAVNMTGRLRPTQLGIWSDEHIPGMKKLTDSCKAEGSVILLQINHAGLLAHPGVTDFVYGPSVDFEIPASKELTEFLILQIINDFILAAVRAEKAGFNGIELHGAHLFLLCQFSSKHINKRNDKYGGQVENRLRLASEIIHGIRKAVNNNFIISYRMGANVPLLEDGIDVANELSKKEIDLLHVSHAGHENTPVVPVDFMYNWIVYSGSQIKKATDLPVIVVNEIKTPERASYLISNDLADFVAIGKDMLTDHEWANKAANNAKISYCLSCKPKCKRYENEQLCPVKISKELHK